MTEKKMHSGSCLCGGIQYEIHGEIGEIIQCHCQRCRKANGAAYAVNAPVRKLDFKIVQGEALLKKFQSTETTQRCFCSNCGSPIISIKAETPDFYRLRIGTLDTPLAQKPTMHIFAGFKAEWDDICDQLPHYAERPAP
ncbi:GFA family protein [Acinetobacter sp. ANC 3813]|uniref:GFA family protein n=1 Tax=Acinetobacter sp. ANC 3813 TaxID=1977873 RepID=UPI000A340EE4|nr:GFA family protein [Acinetobacter sp. ANC 3813]OTG90124.1 aldehyde-activating protein [Acinetobacter sp. ANC 3813]